MTNLADTLNLKQHVKDPTHKSGHTLDLLYTRSAECNIYNPCAGTPGVVSDHSLLIWKLLAQKPTRPTMNLSYRKRKSVDVDSLCKTIRDSSISLCQNDDINSKVYEYNKCVSDFLDVHVPLQSKSVVMRPAVP